jgi:hypothetical protein
MPSGSPDRSSGEAVELSQQDLVDRRFSRPLYGIVPLTVGGGEFVGDHRLLAVVFAGPTRSAPTAIPAVPSEVGQLLERISGAEPC